MTTDTSTSSDTIKLRHREPSTSAFQDPQSSATLNGRSIRNLCTGHNLWRAYNASICLMVLGNYLTKEESVSSPELLFDVVVHGFQVCVGPDSPGWLKASVKIMNLLRIFQISHYVEHGTSTIPTPANVVDIANHAGNFWALQ